MFNQQQLCICGHAFAQHSQGIVCIEYDCETDKYCFCEKFIAKGD